MYGFKFMKTDMRFRYGDGRKLVSGKKFSIAEIDQPHCCVNGFHASRCLYDAMRYSLFYRGGRDMKLSRLCLVKIDGDIHSQWDKFAGRTIQLICSIPREKNESNDALLKRLITRFKKLPISKRLDLVIPPKFNLCDDLP